MKTATFLAALLSLSTISTASPWSGSEAGLGVAEAANGIERMLFRRQDESSNQASATNSNADKSTTSKASATAKSGSSSTTKSGSNSRTDAKSTSASGSDSASGSSAPTGTSGDGNQSAATTEYDPRLPAGGVQMITPAPISGSQFYKIGDWVTFAWNYTSLSATPSGIDIVASCASAHQTYTIAMNQSVSGPTGMVLWDTAEYQKHAAAPLLTNQYTLIIYDAQGSITDTPKSGYLGVQNSFVFGLYEGQKYTNWSNYNCATCNGALRMSSMERQTWAFLFAMAGITVASFTWFASGFFGVL